MDDINFSLEPVDERPSRKYRKGSKYDPILNEFLASGMPLVRVEVKDKGANYLRTQLVKRIEARGLTSVHVSVVNNVSYLEREKPKPRIRPPDKPGRPR